jgi:hypothetical protein
MARYTGRHDFQLVHIHAQSSRVKFKVFHEKLVLKDASLSRKYTSFMRLFILSLKVLISCFADFSIVSSYALTWFLIRLLTVLFENF